MALSQTPEVGDKLRHWIFPDEYEVTHIDDSGTVTAKTENGTSFNITEDDFELFVLVSKGADIMTEYTAENRVAKKGERIVIVEPCEHDSEDYERGDIFIVDKVDSAGVVTTTGNIVYHEEYEVLPAGMAEKRAAQPGERIVITSPYDDQIECGEEYTVKTSEDDIVITAEDGKAIAHEEYEVLPDAVSDEIERSRKRLMTSSDARMANSIGVSADVAAENAKNVTSLIAAFDGVTEPDKPAQIRAACDELRDLLIRKNHDYGDSFAKQYEKYGLMSALIRMDDKMRRLETLVDGQQAQVAESIEDTLADLAGYALLALVEAKQSKEGR